MAGHSINEALVRGIMLWEKHATEAPDFSDWHQSSARLKVRLPFPLDRNARTTNFIFRFFFSFMAYANLATILT